METARLFEYQYKQLDLENSRNLDSLFAVFGMCFDHEKNILNKEAGALKYI